MVLTLIIMSVLLYKHRDRAREFLLSFASFEGSPRNQPDGAAGGEDFARLRGCVQVFWYSSCASSFGYALPLKARLFGLSANACLFASLQDVAGDLLFLLESKKYTYKEWVDDLSVPYIAFFVVAAGASIATVVAKFVMFVQKSRSRGRASAPAVAIAIALADTAHEERLAKLDKEIEANRLDQRKAYVAALRSRTGCHQLHESNRALQVLRVVVASLRGHSDGYAAATPRDSSAMQGPSIRSDFLR
jgi:hypothetical protein